MTRPVMGEITKIAVMCLSAIVLFSSLGIAVAQDHAKLAFGPYVPLSPGMYEITFTLKIADNKVSQPVANFEVIANAAQAKYVSKTIAGTDFKSPNTYQDFNVQFQTTTGSKDFEFRISYLGGSKLWAEKVGVTLLQSYSREEAMGTDLIRGYSRSKSAANIRSFLANSGHREIPIDDPRFSRRIGYPVRDPAASTGRAWFVEPSMIAVDDASAASPQVENSKPALMPKLSETRLAEFLTGLKARTSKGGLLPVLVFLSGYLFALMNVFVYRRFRGLKHRFRSLILSARILIPRIGRILIVVALVFGILLGTYFKTPALHGFDVRIEYLFIALLLLSLILTIDSRVLAGLALGLLGLSSIFLILEREALAEQTAISVFYFLLSGIALQLIGRVRESRAERVTPGLMRVPPLSLEFNLNHATPDETLFRRRLKKARRLGSGKSVILAVLLGGVLSLTISSSIVGPVPFDFRGATAKVGEPLQPRVLGKEVSAGAGGFAESGGPSAGSDEERIKLEILNGNGMRNDAARAGALLQRNGFIVIETKNANGFDYPQTIIRYKIGKKRGAELVAAALAEGGTLTFSEDLPVDYRADIVVILGRERLDRAKLKILILNGGGAKGEATKTAALLRDVGFTVLASRDADGNDSSGTAVRCKPGLGSAARYVVSLFSDGRTSSISEDLSPRSAADIIVVLGKRESPVHGFTVD